MRRQNQQIFQRFEFIDKLFEELERRFEDVNKSGVNRRFDKANKHEEINKRRGEANSGIKTTTMGEMFGVLLTGLLGIIVKIPLPMVVLYSPYSP